MCTTAVKGFTYVCSNVHWLLPKKWPHEAKEAGWVQYSPSLSFEKRDHSDGPSYERSVETRQPGDTQQTILEKPYADHARLMQLSSRQRNSGNVRPRPFREYICLLCTYDITQSLATSCVLIRGEPVGGCRFQFMPLFSAGLLPK